MCDHFFFFFHSIDNDVSTAYWTQIRRGGGGRPIAIATEHRAHTHIGRANAGLWIHFDVVFKLKHKKKSRSEKRRRRSGVRILSIWHWQNVAGGCLTCHNVSDARSAKRKVFTRNSACVCVCARAYWQSAHKFSQLNVNTHARVEGEEEQSREEKKGKVKKIIIWKIHSNFGKHTMSECAP